MLRELIQKKLINPPKWLPENVVNLSYNGSHAYGINHEESDYDVYGIAVPSREVVFPHLLGHIPSFGKPPVSFNHWTEQHIIHNGREYDFSVHNIVRWFHLVMEGNPNLADHLMVPDDVVLFKTRVWDMIRKSAHLFPHKGWYFRYQGYATSQRKKLKNVHLRKPSRVAIVEKFGFDTKFAAHGIRLLLQGADILNEGWCEAIAYLKKNILPKYSFKYIKEV